METEDPLCPCCGGKGTPHLRKGEFSCPNMDCEAFVFHFCTTTNKCEYDHYMRNCAEYNGHEVDHWKEQISLFRDFWWKQKGNSMRQLVRSTISSNSEEWISEHYKNKEEEVIEKIMDLFDELLGE
jgi:hypothetical protein